MICLEILVTVQTVARVKVQCLMLGSLQPN
uniref:Uncharacterized protein n=1 Tax=Arundo donax TaxID=35708 RepID=A0A0A8ZC70_ARUDO